MKKSHSTLLVQANTPPITANGSPMTKTPALPHGAKVTDMGGGGRF
jgi:hypothetical protein